MTLFIAVGDLFKQVIRKDEYGILALVIYCLAVVIGSSIYGVDRLPYVTAGFGTTMAGWPLHIVLALSGSVAILWIARRIGTCAWLGYLGRNSLVVYMTQWATLCFLLEIFSGTLNGGLKSTSFVSVVVIGIATCAVAVVIAYCVDVTPLRIVLGKRFTRTVNKTTAEHGQIVHAMGSDPMGQKRNAKD